LWGGPWRAASILLQDLNRSEQENSSQGQEKFASVARVIGYFSFLTDNGSLRTDNFFRPVARLPSGMARSVKPSRKPRLHLVSIAYEGKNRGK
jgi:hypothetical protein